MAVVDMINSFNFDNVLMLCFLLELKVRFNCNANNLFLRLDKNWIRITIVICLVLENFAKNCF